MRNRRNGWKSFIPWQETPSRTKGPVCLAPVNTVADIIDMCATVNYINGVESINDENPGTVKLKANCVFTARKEGQWRSQTFAAFSTPSGILPAVLKDLLAYTANGSEYALIVADQLPVDRQNVVDVTFNGVASDTMILHKTVASLSASINENISAHSEAFKDAVASRFSFFARQRLIPSVKRESSTNSESSTSKNNLPQTSSIRILQRPRPRRPTSITPAPPPQGRSPNMTATTFKKPTFASIEDLLFAFATHTIDHRTGHGRPLAPHESPADPSKCQALVFCCPVGPYDMHG